MPHIDPKFLANLQRISTVAFDLGWELRRDSEEEDNRVSRKWKELNECLREVNGGQFSILPKGVKEQLRNLVNLVREGDEILKRRWAGAMFPGSFHLLAGGFQAAGRYLWDELKNVPVIEIDPLSWANEEASGSEEPRQTLAESHSEGPGTDPGRSRTGGPNGAGAQAGASQQRTTKKRLENSDKESDKLRLEVYKRIRAEHDAGKKPAAILAELKANRDHKEQITQAGLKLSSAMVRAALAFFDQRERQSRKNQDPPST
jgi:hypothetical protein